MRKDKGIIAICFYVFLLCISLPLPVFSNELKESKVVATVNGSAITHADLNMEINRLLPQELYHRNVTPEKQAEIEKKALENLINAKLLSIEAKRQGLKINNSEFKKRVDAIKSSFQTKKAFENALKKSGLTTTVFEEKMREGMMVERLLEKEVKVSLADKDLEDYYNKNREKFKEPESVRLRYIYVRINLSELDGRKKAKERAKEAYSKIMAGSDFAKIAETYSNDMSRIKGGDVGFVHRGTMLQDIEEVAFSLKVGQVSEILETDIGYHIIKVEEKRASRYVPFKEIKDKLMKELTESMQKERLEGLIKRLRENAKIEYQNG